MVGRNSDVHVLELGKCRNGINGLLDGTWELNTGGQIALGIGNQGKFVCSDGQGGTVSIVSSEYSQSDDGNPEQDYWIDFNFPALFLSGQAFAAGKDFTEGSLSQELGGVRTDATFTWEASAKSYFNDLSGTFIRTEKTLLSTVIVNENGKKKTEIKLRPDIYYSSIGQVNINNPASINGFFNISYQDVSSSDILEQVSTNMPTVLTASSGDFTVIGTDFPEAGCIGNFDAPQMITSRTTNANNESIDIFDTVGNFDFNQNGKTILGTYTLPGCAIVSSLNSIVGFDVGLIGKYEIPEYDDEGGFEIVKIVDLPEKYKRMYIAKWENNEKTKNGEFTFSFNLTNIGIKIIDDKSGTWTHENFDNTPIKYSISKRKTSTNLDVSGIETYHVYWDEEQITTGLVDYNNLNNITISFPTIPKGFIHWFENGLSLGNNGASEVFIKKDRLQTDNKHDYVFVELTNAESNLVAGANISGVVTSLVLNSGEQNCVTDVKALRYKNFISGSNLSVDFDPAVRQDLEKLSNITPLVKNHLSGRFFETNYVSAWTWYFNKTDGITISGNPQKTADFLSGYNNDLQKQLSSLCKVLNVSGNNDINSFDICLKYYQEAQIDNTQSNIQYIIPELSRTPELITPEFNIYNHNCVLAEYLETEPKHTLCFSGTMLTGFAWDEHYIKNNEKESITVAGNIVEIDINDFEDIVATSTFKHTPVVSSVIELEESIVKGILKDVDKNIRLKNGIIIDTKLRTIYYISSSYVSDVYQKLFDRKIEDFDFLYLSGVELFDEEYVSSYFNSGMVFDNWEMIVNGNTTNVHVNWDHIRSNADTENNFELNNTHRIMGNGFTNKLSKVILSGTTLHIPVISNKTDKNAGLYAEELYFTED
jgi:hypothetical protein